MSAISTALPRINAPTAIEIVDNGWYCDPLAISTRMTATMWSTTTKKIVGGRTARNSSLIFSSTRFTLATEWHLSAAASLDLRRVRDIQRGDGVLGVLEVRHQVVGGAAREALDV